MPKAKLALLLSVPVLIIVVVGAGLLFVRSQTDDGVTIPYSKQAWLASSTRGLTNDRYRMRENARKQISKADSKARVERVLGKPEHDWTFGDAAQALEYCQPPPSTWIAQHSAEIYGYDIGSKWERFHTYHIYVMVMFNENGKVVATSVGGS